MALTRLINTVCLFAAGLLLGGCGAVIAQNPGEGLSPVNAVTIGESKRVLLGGADVVSYFTEQRFVQGKPEHTIRLGGVDLYFSSDVNRTLFMEMPHRYLPQYGGYCANGIMFGIPWGGNAQDWLVHNGKLYLFGGTQSRDVFALNLERNIELADQYWKAEIDGNNSFVQRAKRLVFRVPHYQSTDDQIRLLKAAGKLQ